NTFLNAMTYSDKTIYPVASCNDADFQNLMDIYLDAVFHPRIYETDKIFRQEGWHYELEEEDAPVRINGVVYNEMKGEFSSAESVLDRYLQNLMLPDTTYGNESGGDPDHIPELTYEAFLDFHRRYYHPSNSYIYLYGDMDMEEKLRFIDEEYLKDFDVRDPESDINLQTAFDAPREYRISYASDDDEDGSYLALAMSCGDELDAKEYLALSILDYALLGAPGAPLKQTLMDRGLGRDVFGGTSTGIRQPFFTVQAKDVDPARKQEFLDTVFEVLRDQAEKGIRQRTLLAGLTITEFRIREADFGSYPKGLMYGIQAYDSWLYDDEQPYLHLKYNDTFEYLRNHIGDGYFEGLIKKYLLDNPHQVFIQMDPDKELTARKEAELAEKMEAFKKTLSPEQIRDLVRQTKELKACQEEKDSPEDLARIPMLSREDIGREARRYVNELRHEKGGDVLFHDIFCGGLGYLQILFDVDGLSVEELQYASLLGNLFALMNTEHYSYQDLSDEIGCNCGGISGSLGSYDKRDDYDHFLACFNLRGKARADKAGFLFKILEEIALTSRLDDKKRLKEIISMSASRMEIGMVSSGHLAAVRRSNAGLSAAARYNELTHGIAYARFIMDLEEHFDEKSDEITARLAAVRNKIFRPSRMLVSYTSDEDGYALLLPELETFTAHLAAWSGDQEAPSSDFYKEKTGFPELEEGSELTAGFRKRQGLATSAQVQYAARTGSFTGKGSGQELPYTSRLRILSVILNYDYLWMNLRVQGGAYGCMSGFSRTGESYFVSYRDPNLKETYEVYQRIPEYLRSFDADERDMTKYIIGTISGLDTPLPPSARGAASLGAWLSGLTDEIVQKERDDILSCQPEDIRALAPYVQNILDSGYMCTVGGESKIRSQSQLFDVIEPIFG
ncbi:MAG: insulinase family protein, partial [Lachnospiraceae bacterium]|nr:insulinase family protein [Lachnospiraceae bacterium]